MTAAQAREVASMSKKTIGAIEDYLLGRIAGLEDLIRNYGSGDKSKLPTARAVLLELRHTLKQVREIVKAGK